MNGQTLVARVAVAAAVYSIDRPYDYSVPSVWRETVREGQRVIVLTGDGRYVVQKKLYELETELGEANFIRISKSEIVNIHKIKSLDLSITGTIRLVMKTGYETYVSRRNVSKIKEKLTKERLEGRA